MMKKELQQQQALENSIEYFKLEGIEVHVKHQEGKRKTKTLLFLVKEGKSIGPIYEYEQMNAFIRGIQYCIESAPKENIFPTEKTVFLNVSDIAKQIFINGNLDLYSVNEHEQTERLIETFEDLIQEMKNFPICIELHKKDIISFIKEEDTLGPEKINQKEGIPDPWVNRKVIYPFSEGEKYYTIDYTKKEVVKSYWDHNSEETFHATKMYFSRKKQAKEHLKDIIQSENRLNRKSLNS